VLSPDDKTGEYDLIRCALLARAFGLRITAVQPDELPAVRVRAYKTARESWEDDILAGFLAACLRARGGTISPFRDYLEGPESVIALYQRFGARLNELSDRGGRASFGYLLNEITVATAAALWHLPEDATVTIDVPEPPPGSFKLG
jgi:hypothetical protein